MAIFSGKIVSARFLNWPESSIIEVLYNEGDKVIPYVLHVDYTDQEFLDLIDEMSIDTIEEITEKQNLLVINKLNADFEAEVKRRFEQEKQNGTEGSGDDFSAEGFMKFINDKNDDTDIVFALKILILEDQEIAKSPNKNLKLSIRKAKTIVELMSLYYNAKG